MDYDIAKLSPSMSAARLQDNHGAAIIKLAKKTMEQKSDMLSELMDSSAAVIPASPSPLGTGATIDVKL